MQGGVGHGVKGSEGKMRFLSGPGLLETSVSGFVSATRINADPSTARSNAARAMILYMASLLPLPNSFDSTTMARMSAGGPTIR